MHVYLTQTTWVAEKAQNKCALLYVASFCTMFPIWKNIYDHQNNIYRVGNRLHYKMFYEKTLALKKPHMELSQLYDCREHVAHLCLEFASSSCGLKWNMNHHPLGI